MKRSPTVKEFLRSVNNFAKVMPTSTARLEVTSRKT